MNIARIGTPRKQGGRARKQSGRGPELDRGALA